jgi:hypothetical protein
MIPAFDDNGYLPPGIHKATLEEVAERFGWQSEVRRDEIESLQWLMGVVKGLHVKRLILNGGFVTDELEPDDVDCIILIDPAFPRNRALEEEVLDGLPFLEIDVVEEIGFDILVKGFFATDRNLIPKGMVEVVL